MANRTWSYEGNAPHTVGIELTREGVVCTSCGAQAQDHFFVEGVNDSSEVFASFTLTMRLPVREREAIGGYSKAEPFGFRVSELDSLEYLTREDSRVSKVKLIIDGE